MSCPNTLVAGQVHDRPIGRSRPTIVAPMRAGPRSPGPCQRIVRRASGRTAAADAQVCTIGRRTPAVILGMSWIIGAYCAGDRCGR